MNDAHDCCQGTTQRITANDISSGQIRIPSTGHTKCLLPPHDCDGLEVVLRGKRLDSVPYRPRYGPDRERSGVLRVGSEVLERQVVPNETLTVTRVKSVYVLE